MLEIQIPVRLLAFTFLWLARLLLVRLHACNVFWAQWVERLRSEAEAAFQGNDKANKQQQRED